MLDSLLKQNIAILALTAFGALVVSLVLIVGLVLRPQFDRSAADMAQLVRGLELSFQEMDAAQQIDFAEALRADEASVAQVADDAPEDATQEANLLSQYFLHLLSKRYDIKPPDVRIDAEGRVWVRIATARQPYWLALRSLPPTDPVVGLSIASGIALLAALAGGIALQRRIARPLKRLEEAVGLMSSPSDPYVGKIDRPREIAAVSRALTGMSERLNAAEADRALMLAGVSHDLRTPLTKLRLSLALMKGADPTLVAGAERNVIRIEGMLGQFLDFARGFEAEETRAVPLRPVLQRAVEACVQPAAVRIDAPEGLVVSLKEAAVQRALENLLSNALRYGKPPIEIGARTAEGEVRIHVRDSGQGMCPDEAHRLLRPFARGNSARSGEGTGLGLAIVDQVAKAHGGRVEFEQDSEAFTVRIRIPQPILKRQ